PLGGLPPPVVALALRIRHRICGIYDLILVDEGQDFAGYDYDLLLALMGSCKNMTIVGDPRQQTYRTNNGQINSGYSNVFEFFDQRSSFPIDTTSLSEHRKSTSCKHRK
ncbi:hypothetical protein DW781_10795, partial [Olsenella sp. AM30-3LB]|uniref:UvrD-helicase domain-containing protein n=1 Tax=Olsenella sp. AM30-3LB TaxID=2292359 RepID=UPI000FF3534C